MPRFALLLHEVPGEPPHLDLLLEREGSLATWRFADLPAPGATPGVPATRLPDHRRLYLDHEGDIGGDRGTVRRRDQGTYEIRRWDETAIQVVLRGAVLRGRVHLDREANGTWRMTRDHREG